MIYCWREFAVPEGTELKFGDFLFYSLSNTNLVNGIVVLREKYPIVIDYCHDDEGIIALYPVTLPSNYHKMNLSQTLKKIKNNNWNTADCQTVEK